MTFESGSLISDYLRSIYNTSSVSHVEYNLHDRPAVVDKDIYLRVSGQKLIFNL